MEELFIPIEKRDEIYKVYLDQINYIERRGRQIDLKIVKGKITFNGNIDYIATLLDNRFYMCHGGLIVNLEHINKAKNQRLEFMNGDCKFIGIHNFRQTRKAYKHHLEDIFFHRKKGASGEHQYH